jgi:hypothetical protein
LLIGAAYLCHSGPIALGGIDQLIGANDQASFA